MTTLVDTDVLIDIAVRDPVWLKWSRAQLEKVRGAAVSSSTR